MPEIVKALIILCRDNCSFDTRIRGTAKNRLIRKERRATEYMTGKRRTSRGRTLPGTLERFFVVVKLTKSTPVCDLGKVLVKKRP